MNIPKWRRIFFIFNDCMDAGGRAMQEQLPRRKNRRVVGYVTILTTQEINKKASKLGIFFVGNCLNAGASVFPYFPPTQELIEP
jgi:hypothetical protein